MTSHLCSKSAWSFQQKNNGMYSRQLSSKYAVVLCFSLSSKCELFLAFHDHQSSQYRDFSLWRAEVIALSKVACPPPPPQRMTGGRQYGPTVIGSCGCVPTLPTVKKYKTCQGKTARLYGFYIIVHITVSSQFYWTILWSV